MNVLGLIFLAGFGVSGSLALRGDHLSMFCHTCHHVDDPSKCTTLEKCWAGGKCGGEARTVDGHIEFKLGCYEQKECDAAPALVGKRAHHDHHNQLLCRQCCTGENCNKNTCGAFAVAPTLNPTSGVVGHVGGACVNHEEDGFACSMFNKASVCGETDPTTYSYILAHSKCPLYCGFCSADKLTTVGPIVDATTAVILAPGCADIETNGFLCANFDLFNFCTDTTSFAYPLAGEKCRKHCGFCTDTSVVGTGAPVMPDTTTAKVVSATTVPVAIETKTMLVDLLTTTATILVDTAGTLPPTTA